MESYRCRFQWKLHLCWWGWLSLTINEKLCLVEGRRSSNGKSSYSERRKYQHRWLYIFLWRRLFFKSWTLEEIGCSTNWKRVSWIIFFKEKEKPGAKVNWSRSSLEKGTTAYQIVKFMESVMDILDKHNKKGHRQLKDPSLSFCRRCNQSTWLQTTIHAPIFTLFEPYRRMLVQDQEKHKKESTR